jgi:hypothetical protein
LNILITAATTAQAYRLQRIINNNGSIYLGDHVELPGLALMGKTFVKIPGDMSVFSHALLTLCLDLKIDVVYPLRKSEVLALSEARQLFDEYGIKVMVPSKEHLAGYMDISIADGELVVIDQPASERPDRGVFIKHKSQTLMKLFTVN